MIELASAYRTQMSIASNEDELVAMAETIEVAGQKGAPVLLIPFGCENEPEHWIRADTISDVRQAADKVFHNAYFYNYVHVLKAWPIG